MKTGATISEINKARPIVVQNLIIRLIEKVQKRKLESWQAWKNLNADTYQWGLKKNSTLVNLIRMNTSWSETKRRETRTNSLFFY